MTSNDDLMNFLKSMEAKREKDKEEMAEARRRERQEDREEMMTLMENFVGEKVEKLTEPYIERTEKLEKGQAEIKEQVNMLLDQMKLVNDRVVNKNEGTQSNITVSMGFQTGNSSSRYVEHQEVDNQEDRKKDLISLSRRTVGLQRIDRQDIQRMFRAQYGGAKSEEEAKLLAVKEYLKLELKLSEVAINEMEIERIFTPARENPEWLYVTFKQETSVSKIFEKTRVMRKDSRIMTYIPKEYHSRFEAMRDLANRLRLEEDCKTRIKMGYKDLQLHRKDRSTGRWELVPIPVDFPPVNFGTSPEKPMTGSPAPGRPEQSRDGKRNRESTGSPDLLVAKAARKEDTDQNIDTLMSKSDETDPKNVVEEAGGDQDTTGKVIDEESYCPASPAPTKSSNNFPYSSPIFSKSKTSSLAIKPALF